MADNIVWLDFNDAPDQELSITESGLDAKELKSRLLERLSDVLVWLFPNGKTRGRQFFIGDLQGNRGKSLVVELEGPKAGMWIDFATGESGDVFDLWSVNLGLDSQRQFPELMREISRWLGDAPPVESRTVLHKPPVDDLGPWSAKWDYHDAAGNLIACVYRYDTPDGKEYRPWDVSARKMRAPNPRPLYNQPGLSAGFEVVLVEGEKAADALIQQGIMATTAMNGANAPVDKTDWSSLKNKRVLIWPDKDEAGMQYAERVRNALLRVGTASVAILEPPADKPDKWDAFDAVAEKMDVATFLQSAPRFGAESSPGIPVFSLGQLLADTSPMPDDLIEPRVLTPGGMIVFGGAPKVGKSDFLLTMLTHMAAGEPFLELNPPRPLRVFYLQAEVQYHYLRERFQAMQLPTTVAAKAAGNLKVTPQLKLVLNDDGVAQVAVAMREAFVEPPLDVLVIDPIRNVFDGGPDGASENDNNAMLFFLRERVEQLRDAVNPEAGVILAHHTKKIGKKQVEEDPFQALSGAGSLRGYYTTGMLLYRPDESRTDRMLVFELRNGPGLPPKRVDKSGGCWVELDQHSERLVNQDHGARLDAERRRKRDVILQLIFDEAADGRIYTANQFAESFEGKAGLGANRTINERLAVLATKGYIKFFRNPEDYGLPPLTRSKFGHLCVEQMALPGKEQVDTDTGEVVQSTVVVKPTHYKCPQTGAVLPVENPNIWIYQEEDQE
ncbi:MAG: AAA family ATPase [Candidatus Sedimenticola sp. 6PFRAG5]